MSKPKLNKSKRFIQRNFHGLHPLSVPAHAISFRIENLEKDMKRLESDLTGILVNKRDEKVAVIAEGHSEYKNCLYVEFLDLQKGNRIGHVTLVFRPQWNDFYIGYLNLIPIQKRGFGKKITEIFCGFMPDGVKINCVIEEKNTRNLLKNLTQELMEKGEITDWTINSPHRPKPKVGEGIPMPLIDQEKIEFHFLQKINSQKTPITALMESFQATFKKLRTCLSDDGKFVYLLTYTHRKKESKDLGVAA